MFPRQKLPKLKELLIQLKEERVGDNEQAEYLLECITWGAVLCVMTPLLMFMSLPLSTLSITVSALVAGLFLLMVWSWGVHWLSHVYQKHNGKKFLLVAGCLLGHFVYRVGRAIGLIVIIILPFLRGLKPFEGNPDAAWLFIMSVPVALGLGSCLILWLVKRQMVIVARGQSE